MKNYIKPFISYTLIIIAGILISAGSVKLYLFLSKPEPYTIADTKIHFQDTQANVILYSTSWCPVCKQTRNFFIKNNIVYVDYDIETASDDIIERYQTTGSDVIPTIIINNKIFKGFYPDAMQADLILAQQSQ